MYEQDRVSRLTVELTTQCSARCPQCPRNWRGDTNPLLPLVELSLSDIQHIFPSHELQRFRTINAQGSYGDATAARDTVPIMEYFRATKPEVKLQIHSHGSARSVGWWKRLAALGVRVVFSVDGLEDTNHIYRRYTNWQLIMRNAAAFIGAGGKAEWHFLVFEHNEHQVDEARRLSQEMGFKKFYVKRTGRFTFNAKQQIFAKDGTVAGELRPASQREEFKNRSWTNIKSDFRDRRAYNLYLQTTPIVCKAQTLGGGLFLSAEALVFPCCWLRHIHHVYPDDNSRCEQLSLLDKIPGGRSSICARDRPISEIIHSPFFQQIVPDGWEAGPNRTLTCAFQCGAYSKKKTQEKALFFDG